jgi:hypothetical protein
MHNVHLFFFAKNAQETLREPVVSARIARRYAPSGPQRRAARIAKRSDPSQTFSVLPPTFLSGSLVRPKYFLETVDAPLLDLNESNFVSHVLHDRTHPSANSRIMVRPCLHVSSIAPPQVG